MRVREESDPGRRIPRATRALVTARRFYHEKCQVYDKTRDHPQPSVRDDAARRLADAYRALRRAHDHLLTEVIATRPTDSPHDLTQALGLPIDYEDERPPTPTGAPPCHR